MNKLLCLLLTVVMLFGCIPAMAEGGTFTANEKMQAITVYKGSDENLVVPASVDGISTPVIYRQALGNAKKAATLSFEEGVRQIRANNIDGLMITQLSLPESLEVIGSNNIYQTDKLSEVTVPAAVSYVGTLSFSYCDVLTKVTFTGPCPVFAPRCFVSTASGLVVYVPDDQLEAYKAALPEELNIQPSGKNAVDARVRVSESDFEFDAATGTIKKYNGTASFVEIPATIGGVPVKTIGQKTFYQHRFITVVVVPEGVETLEMYSIFGSASLNRVVLPSTLKTIGKNALWGNDLDSLVLPDGLKTIGESAFGNSLNTKMDELVIPDSVTSIGKEAFSSCKAVKVVIGANVNELPDQSFGTLHYVTEIVIRNTSGMTISADAFQNSKKGASITLMDGITEEVYNGYVEQLAAAYQSAIVNQPEVAYAFPKLDAEAGKVFIGKWNGVAVTDGTDVYGMDLLGMSISVELLEDGAGVLTMDTENTDGGWYVEDGAVIFAPVLEEGGLPAIEEAIPFTLDENSRMNIDFGGIILLMEKDGMEYAESAIPEKSWPELDESLAAPYIGTWEAVKYVIDGEMYDAELIGKATLTLNADGTAQIVEGEAEAYELQWYAETYSAYAGPDMNNLAEIYFDMNGDLQMKQDGGKIIMKPWTEETAAETSDTILGNWDDGFKTLDVYEDGSMDLTYKSDGYVSKMEWAVSDGVPTVTKGIWKGAPIRVENGLLIIEKDTLYQEFERVGEAPDVIVGADDDFEQPETQDPAIFMGDWYEEDDMGVLTFEEGKATMNFTDGRVYDFEWETTETGAIFTSGLWANTSMVIEENGSLNIGGGWMILYREGYEDEGDIELIAQPVGEEGAAYFGQWNLVSMAGMDVSMFGMTMTLSLNQDGTAVIFDGESDEIGVWQIVDGKAFVMGTELIIDDAGSLVMGNEDMPMVFVRDTEAVDEPTKEPSNELVLHPIGAEGEAYFGVWKLKTVMSVDAESLGMSMEITLKRSSVCKIVDGGETRYSLWYVEDGIAKVEGLPVMILDEFRFAMPNGAAQMVFSRINDVPDNTDLTEEERLALSAILGAQTESEFAFMDVTLVLTKAEMIFNGQAYSVDVATLGEFSVCFHADGSAMLVQLGLALPSEYLTWSVSDQGSYVVDYSVGDTHVMEYVFNPTDVGVTMDYNGTLMTFSPAE